MKSNLSIDALSRVRTPAAILVALFALSGCATGRIPFTQGLRDQYGLDAEDLKKLQYFVSSDITLERGFRSEEGEISQTHKLVIKEGGLSEELVIPAGTPGVATEVRPTSLAVSFGPGGSLVFGSPPSDRDSERKYKISAKRWTDDSGELIFDNKTYYAVRGSGQAFLEVGAESLDAVKKSKRYLPGMTLPSK